MAQDDQQVTINEMDIKDGELIEKLNQLLLGQTLILNLSTARPAMLVLLDIQEKLHAINPTKCITANNTGQSIHFHCR